MTSISDNISLSSNQNINRFWYKQRLNFKSLIQPLKILLIKVTGIHNIILICCILICIILMFYMK